MKLINDDRIDKYLRAELSDEERDSFEDAIAKDEDLRLSVEFYKEVALSAARIHDAEVLSLHRSQTCAYKWKLFWTRFKFSIISAITAIGLTAAGIGTEAIIAVQRFIQATNPYITQLAPAVARDDDDVFANVDSMFDEIQSLLLEKNFDRAQDKLDTISLTLSSIKDNGLYSEDDIITYEQSVEFTQAVIYAQRGKGLKAKRIFRQIATQESHIYKDDALKILKKKNI